MQLTFQTLWQKIKQPFRQGLGRNEIAKAIIVSLLVTVLPIFGVTTIILTFLAVKFKLNLPIMVAVSYIATPLQFIFFMPFIHVGEAIFNTKHTLLTVIEIKNAFESSFFHTIKQLIFELVCGVSGWLLLALPIALVSILLINKINYSKNETI
ncbi:uncharacterized protein DUF2062 [Mariniflexile fucanivorans]|uniref:Uncharacterized protein DUF2062 n=1 Tax=Mariniflexile fucanivorans TaxID=264023 RepID=A0A4V2QD13_9FLAO|nr:DUF2062 domain-containing protein [Mariniflexile fucanivorans]TCL62617.1 uncharacterized protein DUF2062 [Mariniflexile fucanivorans]